MIGRFQARRYFIAGGLAIIVCCLADKACLAMDKSLIYKFYDDQTGQIIGKSYVTIESLSDGQLNYAWRMEDVNGSINAEFVLDDNYMTRLWSWTHAAKRTDYRGEKDGHTLYIKGMLNGETIDKKIALDDKPFYDMPRFNLAKFVLSDQRNVKFWTLRKNKLTKVLMEARKREQGTLLVNGKHMHVVKVLYSENGVREEYYRRLLYFRTSDGLFVKEAASDHFVADLVSEK